MSNDETVVDKRILNAGTFLYRQDEEASKAYLIQQGQVKITKLVEGKKVEIATLKSGDIVGERALLPSTKHSTSAEVIGQGAIVIMLERSMLSTKYKKTDNMIKTVIKSLIERLEHANEQRLEAEKQIKK